MNQCAHTSTSEAPDHLTLAQRAGAVALMGVLAAYAVVLLSEPALANAVGGQEFEDIYTTLTDWLQGTVGKIIVAAFAAVGFIAGIVQQSLMGFAVAFGAAIGLNWLPQIIDAVFSHTLPLY